MALQYELEETGLANAPRADRPPTYRAKRRPSKGNRHVARPMRDRLSIAADLLDQTGDRLKKAGDRLEKEERLEEAARQREEAARHHDAAADVRAILAPAGWTLLRQKAGEKAPDVTVPLNMPVSLRNGVVLAADDIGVTVSAVFRDGLQAVAEGRWVPPRAGSSPSRGGKAEPTVNLSTRVPEDLKQAVQEKLSDLTKQLGYRVSMSSIGAWWLSEELGVEHPYEANTGKVKMVTDRRLLEHFRLEAEARGLSLTQILNEGITRVLSEGWMPPVDEWLSNVSLRPRGQSGAWTADPEAGPRPERKRSKLTVAVDEGLLEGLRRWCGEQESEWPLHPAMLAIAILKDRLGEPAE